MSDWKYEKLSKLCFRIGDGLHGTPEYSESSDVYFINGNNLKNGKIEVTENTKKVTSEELSKNFIQLDNNSLLLSINGTLGSMAFFKNEKVMLGKSAAYLNFKNEINKFYFYYFQLPSVQEHFHNVATGSTIKNLSLKSIQDFEVPVPESNIWKNISKVLSSLDAKIELNNKINDNLEQMAKTLYDYWFVQFDFPDANGKPYKTLGGKTVWNQELKREIPLDWEVKTLLDIATFSNGLACQKFRPNENEEFYKVIKIREMGTGFTENSEFVSLNIPEKVVVYNGDILFSWSATLDVKIWTGGTGGLNQHIFKVTSKNYPKSYYYFELLNYLQHFKMMAELRKTTMGHITQDHLRESRITIPPKRLINELDKVLNPILEKKVKLDIENQELASLRDWLLPMLMNGQVSVGDFEEELGMVAEARERYGK